MKIWTSTANYHEMSSLTNNTIQNVDPVKVEMIKRVFWGKPKQKEYKEVSDYFNEIHENYCPPRNIMERSRQPMINYRMRALLIEWMMKVSSEFGLKRETYYLALNYLDRYVGKVNNIEK